MIKILKEQFRFMDHLQVKVQKFQNLLEMNQKIFIQMTFQKKIFNYEKGVTRALLKIAEFVEADLNDGLTGRTTKVLDNFMIFGFY